MRVVSVNVARPEEIRSAGQTVRTGIFKRPVEGRVKVRRLNLDGDAQADLVNHGGVDKAVYAYPFEHYAHWARELGRHDLGYGQFGENLTTEGLTEEEVSVGDVFRAGTSLVQVSQPRSPCFKLAMKMGLPNFPKVFLASLRVGFYLRVLEEGDVASGDAIERVEPAEERMSIREITQLMYFEPRDPGRLRLAARLEALSPSWRESFLERAAR